MIILLMFDVNGSLRKIGTTPLPIWDAKGKFLLKNVLVVSYRKFYLNSRHTTQLNVISFCKTQKF